LKCKVIVLESICDNKEVSAWSSQLNILWDSVDCRLNIFPYRTCSSLSKT
jgi:hypothetical protein